MSIAEPPAAAEEELGDARFLEDLRHKARFNLGPQMRRALELQKKLGARWRIWEDYLNSRDTGGTLLVGAAVQQMLRSASPGGSWHGKAHLPTFSALRNELVPLVGDHDGIAIKDSVLEKFRRERALVERIAWNLTIYLESGPFLYEFNNYDANGGEGPFYDAVGQLYFSNLFSLYLPSTEAGLAYLKRCTEFEPESPSTAPPPLLPVYHPTRFHEFFPLRPDLDGVSRTYYDPATRTYDLDGLGLFKGLADGVVAAYLAHHAPVVAGLVQKGLTLTPPEDAWMNKLFAEALHAYGVKRIAGVDSELTLIHWELVWRDSTATREGLRNVPPAVGLQAAGVLSILGTWVGIQKYRNETDPTKKSGHLLETTKEATALCAAASEGLLAARQRLGKEIFDETLANFARRMNLVSAAADQVMNGQQLLRDMFHNADQVPASALKAAGATLALGAIGWSVFSGGVLAGPVGVGIALVVMATVIAGSILETYLADHYLERFLNLSSFGTGHTHSQDPTRFEFRFWDTEVQLSAYLRMLLAARLQVQALVEEVDGVPHTRYFATLESAHPLAEGARVTLTQVGGGAPAAPKAEFSLHGMDSELWEPGVSEDWAFEPVPGQPAPDPDALYQALCRRVEYESPRIPGNLVGRHLMAEIVLADEASRLVLQSLVSAATDAPARLLPFTRPLKLFLVARLEPVQTQP